MNIVKKIVAKMAGKKFAKAIDLKEGAEMDTKKWWKSKSIWTGVVTVLIATYETAQKSLAPQFGYQMPEIPPVVYVFLGATGIYTRAIASTKVAK